MDTYIFKLNVFTKLSKYEWNTASFTSFRVFNMWAGRASAAKRCTHVRHGPTNMNRPK